MKRSRVALVGIFCMFMAGEAHAQTASSYDNPVTAPQEKPLAGYEGGFYLRSADDAFRLQIYSRLQFQYFFQDIRLATATDTSTFRMRRARFYLFGTLFKNFSYSLWASHGTGAAAPSNTFWWADMTAHVVPQFNVTAGIITNPLDLQGDGSSGKMAFIEQNLTATQVDGVQNQTIARQAFGNPATLGVRLWGDIGRFHYTVGVGNGDAQNIFNQTKQPAFGTRVWVDILGKSSYEGGFNESDLAYLQSPLFFIGAGSSYDGQDAVDANINNVTVNWAWTSAGSALFQWKGLTLLSEAYFRRLKVATGAFSLDDLGYYMQAGYFVIPKKLEVVGRVAQMFREGPNNNAYEYAGGLNWFINGNNVKWQFDASRLVDFDANAGTGGTATMRYRTMLTFQI